MRYLGGSAVEKPSTAWHCGKCGAGPFRDEESAREHCSTQTECEVCGWKSDPKPYNAWLACESCSKKDRDEFDAKETARWWARAVVDYRECKHGFFVHEKYIKSVEDLGEEIFSAIEDKLEIDGIRISDAVPMGPPEKWSFSEFVQEHFSDELPEDCDIDDSHDAAVREILAKIWPTCFQEGDKRVDVTALWAEVEGERGCSNSTTGT